ncbi:MAG TPA: phosphohistidine phosphatase SixA [Candidatus Udaeobacter sp.]|nr:phosphohistidine phosphatase SixA [Candidatus Udaeobacter sp.]
MEFYLVRHGEAVSETQDPARPLTEAGRQTVEQVARSASAKAIQVAAVFHSGILRAKQTADILATHLHPTAGVRTMSGLLPEDDPAIARSELEAAQQSILLVGHLPHMNRLAALLASGDPDRELVNFAPAMMICFSHEKSQWTIAWVLAPQLP